MTKKTKAQLLEEARALKERTKVLEERIEKLKARIEGQQTSLEFATERLSKLRKWRKEAEVERRVVLSKFSSAEELLSANQQQEPKE